MIDRISPTKRPARVAAGYQSWRSLFFMHWPVPLEVLRPLVPRSLEIDTFDGVAYVGLVPFAMNHVRPRWAPKVLGFNFLETNVRTYVTHGDRPGVYFFSLDAASRIGVWTARTFWGLPYYHAEMSLKHEDDRVQYRSRRTSSDVSHSSECQIGQQLAASHPGSLEFFFLERYLLFLERRDQLLCGQVHHTPYPACEAEVTALEDGLLRASGLECCTGPPPFAHYSSGVDVEIFSLQRC